MTVITERAEQDDEWDFVRKLAHINQEQWRFWTGVNMCLDACWTWDRRTDHRGYGRTAFRGRYNVGAHQVAWALSHELDALPRQWVLHHCDNPPCVRPSHLFLGDATENNRDRQNKGRTRGWAGLTEHDHHAFRIDSAQAQAMVELRSIGATQQAIADQFGVSRGHVSKIIRGLTVASGKAIS